MIGRACTDSLRFLWVSAPNVAHVTTGGKRWLKKLKSERNEIEIVSFHYCNCEKKQALYHSI